MNRTAVEEIKARIPIEELIGSYVKLEKAGKAEAAAVQQAMQGLDVSNNPAASLLPGGSHLRFAPNGRRMDTAVQVVQWQSGRPVVVAPTDVANGQLKRRG